MNNDKLISILLFSIFAISATKPLIDLIAINPMLILLAFLLYPGLGVIRALSITIKEFKESF